jgi:3'(2'), 5'-bisphosphate nucleotidase
MAPDDPRQWLPLVIDAVLDAGREILAVYDTEFTVTHKADDSPLTLADERSHAVLSASLKTTAIPILSEEGRQIPFEERCRWDRLWVVDPLDGTKEFVSRNGEFTVNVALVDQGRPILGVVFAPVPDLLFFAAAGVGAFRITDAAAVLTVLPDRTESLAEMGRRLPLDDSPRTLKIVASRSHLNAATAAYIDGLRRRHPDLETVSRGSSLKLCLVAEGSAQVYPRFAPTMEWDTAAGHAVVAAAGGRVQVAETGLELGYNRRDLLNPAFIALAANAPETMT